MGNILDCLNEQQKAAVLTSMDKNVVLLAGAGSGKTKTMVVRGQYLIEEKGVNPANMLMVTFTNKAASEIADRMLKASPNAGAMWIGTFHRICTRIMRMHGKVLNIDKFTIMDTKDSKALIKEILDDFGVDNNQFMINDVLTSISRYKNNLLKPAQVLADPNEKKTYANVYQEYENRCWRRKTFDFDDLIIYGILLLSSYPNIAQWAHDKFKYVCVDEMQDSNSAQFVLVNLLAGDNNVMLCGDVNQSIYAFRNAKPKYLNDFANNHSNTVVMKLEKNYRSTKTIINAANRVVENNSFGTKLEMFCDNEEGRKIQLFEAIDPYMEAKWIVSEIIMRKDKKLSDFAIIYRANYQSRILEEEFNKNGIPYTIFGAQSFYGRKEVRDLLAWLRLYSNSKDAQSFRRVASTFKGVGETTVDKIVEYMEMNRCDASKAIEDLMTGDRRVALLVPVKGIIDSQYKTCFDVITAVICSTSYRKDLAQSSTDDAIERVAIIDEFHQMLMAMSKENITMDETIDQIALLSETKGNEKENLEAVKFMTAHASKGLEFDTVFIAGAEEGTFPHSNALSEGPDAIEEERRLFYVAMTRAQKELYITHSTQRKFNYDGNMQFCKESRFIKEIPWQLIEETF